MMMYLILISFNIVNCHQPGHNLTKTKLHVIVLATRKLYKFNFRTCVLNKILGQDIGLTCTNCMLHCLIGANYTTITVFLIFFRC